MPIFTESQKEFFAAITAGETNKVRELLEKEPNLIHTVDEEGNNALHIVAKAKVLKALLATFLLGKKPELNQVANNKGELPLMVAQQHNKLLVKILTPSEKREDSVLDSAEKKRKLNTPETEDRKSKPEYIQGASTEANNFLKLAAELAESKIENKDAITYLKNQIHEILRLNAAFINTQDKEGLTALHHAALSNNYEMVEFLLNQGATIDILDKRGFKAAELTNDIKIQDLLSSKISAQVVRPTAEAKSSNLSFFKIAKQTTEAKITQQQQPIKLAQTYQARLSSQQLREKANILQKVTEILRSNVTTSYAQLTTLIIEQLNKIEYSLKKPTHMKKVKFGDNKYAGDLVNISSLGYMQDPFLVNFNNIDKRQLVKIANHFHKSVHEKIAAYNQQHPDRQIILQAPEAKSEKSETTLANSLYEMNIGLAYYQIKDAAAVSDLVVIAPSGQGHLQTPIWLLMQEVIQEMNSSGKFPYLELQTSYNAEAEESKYDNLLHAILKHIYATKAAPPVAAPTIENKACSEKKIAQLFLKLLAMFDEVKLLAVENSILGENSNRISPEDIKLGRRYSSRLPCTECMKAVPAYHAMRSISAEKLGRAIKLDEIEQFEKNKKDIEKIEKKLMKINKESTDKNGFVAQIKQKGLRTLRG